MAEYYPLLAKAVGRLPNSTPDSRRVVYERARKALIGQLRTQHPPVPDEDIEHESVELDRAVERLEAEIASGTLPGAPPPAEPAPPPASAPPPTEAKPAEATGETSPALPAAAPPEIATPQQPVAPTGAIGPVAKRPIAPLRTRTPGSAPFAKKREVARPAAPIVPAPSVPPPAPPQAPSPDAPGTLPAPPPAAPEAPAQAASGTLPAPPPVLPRATTPAASSTLPGPPPPSEPPLSALAPPEPTSVNRSAPVEPQAPPATATQNEAPVAPAVRARAPRSESARPIAPQPDGSAGSKRRLWIIPVGIGVVVALVAVAAWKLRDRPDLIARTKPADQTQTDSGKIAERVGGPPATTGKDTGKAPEPATPAPDQTARTEAQPDVSLPSNPEIPVAHRAALLVEAPSEPNKVKTFLGTVVWKLNNVARGANDAVGLAVEADIELPDDKMRATVTFEKNADASLAASHTIKVQFSVQPGSYSGDVKQISTPQMRPEASPSGEPLAGVTVPVVPNTFLVGLSPGNAEAANLDLMRRLQWIDIPMLLDNGKIAKLTFEKSDSGQRDLSEAFTAWQK